MIRQFRKVLIASLLVSIIILSSTIQVSACPGGGFKPGEIVEHSKLLVLDPKDVFMTALHEQFPSVQNVAFKEIPLTEEVLLEMNGENIVNTQNYGKLSILVAWDGKIYSVIGATKNNTIALLNNQRQEIEVPKDEFFRTNQMYAISGGVKNKVPNISQVKEGLPYGCEVVSYYMVMKHALGGNITDLRSFTDNIFKYSTDGSPYSGFVGSPYLNYGPDAGWTTSPSAQLDVMKTLVPSAKEEPNLTPSKLKSLLDANAVVAVEFYGFKAHNKPSTPDTCYVHCCVIVGYDSYGYYINDPFVDNPKDGEAVWYSYAAVHNWMQHWGNQNFVKEKHWTFTY